jgi:hypothetical protein
MPGLALAGLGIAPPAALPPPATQQETSVVIVGNSSTLYRSESLVPWLWADEPYVCSTFWLRLKAARVDTVHVTSTGIGPATLALDPPAACSEPASREEQFLTISNLGPTGRRVRIRLSSSLVQGPSGVVHGKILVYEPGRKPVETTLKLANASGNLALALRWFLTVAIPLFIGAALTYVGQKAIAGWNASVKERDDFADYVLENSPQLDEFFLGFYATLYYSETDFGTNLGKELRMKGIHPKLPRRHRAALDAVLLRQDKQKIQERLCVVFPRWRSAIMHPEEPH